ncbi:hypothetical protein [Mycolicibacterium fortuitum]|uniref:hypothetical protein n=1 Tax=Mycolicibacterium fortuitum TaxID=1766 RepID=UPI00262A5AD3|nr:hypothetical protein [Mycolicibacterium fortuitum]
MFVEHLGRNSALFRARNPKTWDWDLGIEFQSAILHTLMNANWQRGGGRGSRPKMIQRPRESDSNADIDLSVGIADRKAAQEDELARRRQARDERRNKQKSRMIAGGGVRHA